MLFKNFGKMRVLKNTSNVMKYFKLNTKCKSLFLINFNIIFVSNLSFLLNKN